MFPDTASMIDSRIHSFPKQNVFNNATYKVEPLNGNVRRKIDMHHELPPLNIAGYIPVFSSITGFGRALVGVIHMVIHTAAAVFSENHNASETVNTLMNELRIGAKGVARGLTEMVPVIGNVLAGFYDAQVTYRHYSEYISEHPIEQ